MPKIGIWLASKFFQACGYSAKIVELENGEKNWIVIVEDTGNNKKYGFSVRGVTQAADLLEQKTGKKIVNGNNFKALQEHKKLSLVSR